MVENFYYDTHIGVRQISHYYTTSSDKFIVIASFEFVFKNIFLEYSCYKESAV